MKCYNCGSDVKNYFTRCPKCFSELTDTSKGKIIVNKRVTLFNMKGILFAIFLFPVILLIGTIGLIALNVLGKVKIATLILKGIFYLAIISLFFYGFLALKNNVETNHMEPDNNSKKTNKKGIALGWIIVSIILLIYPTVFKVILKKTVNLDGIDYAVTKYIQINDIKIPTVYSVVGERAIFLNIGINDVYDENYEFTFDGFSIIYEELSTDDISKYELLLVQDGFIKILAKVDDEELKYIHIKNNSNDTFTIVSIIDSEITYGVVDGNYEFYFDDDEVITGEV